MGKLTYKQKYELLQAFIGFIGFMVFCGVCSVLFLIR